MKRICEAEKTKEVVIQEVGNMYRRAYEVAKEKANLFVEVSMMNTKDK